MKFDRPLLQLPIRFSAEKLAEEVQALPRSAWVPHPQGFVGNDAVPLISPGGELTDSFTGPMEASEHLRSCPYIMGLMAEIGAVWGRSRLMGLAPDAQVQPHVDIHYYWRTHIRIHIPVITNPEVHFTCGGETVHMKPGECWIFDSFQLHNVQNQGSERRVHLVIDTVGGGKLWELIDGARRGVPPPHEPWMPASNGGQLPELLYERINIPELMSSWEVRCHLDFLIDHTLPHQHLPEVLNRLDKFTTGWDAAWVRFGTDDEGLTTYRALIDTVRRDIAAIDGKQIVLTNQAPLFLALEDLVFSRAVGRDRMKQAPARAPTIKSSAEPVPAPAAAPAKAPVPETYRERFDRPIFILSSPRSGSTLLFETLARAPDLFTIGGESHGLIEGIEDLAPAAHEWESNRLTADDARPDIVEQLSRNFYEQLKDRGGHHPQGIVRMLEKTPKNALRVPFLQAAWPDARFVYLYRDVRQTLASMIEAWVSGRFRTYPTLPGWSGPPWSLLLVPGWRDLIGRPIPEIVAHQWKVTTDTLLDDLASVPADRRHVIDYASFVSDPNRSMQDLAGSLGLGWDVSLGARLPMAKHTVSQPHSDKWRAIEHIIAGLWPIVGETNERAQAFVQDRQR